MSIILGRGHCLLHVRTLLAQQNGGEQEICPVHHGSPLDSELLYKERTTPRAPLWEEARGLRVLRRELAQEEMQEEEFLGCPRPDHSRRENFARIRLTSVALKNYVVKWTNWRTKTTRTTSLQKKFVCTATIGGSVRTQLVPIRCQSGIELTSSKHCQPCDSSNTKKIQLISNDGKVIPHLGVTGKNPGGILLMSITTKTDPALIDQGNLLKGDWDTSSRYDSQNSLDASLQFKIR